MHFVIFQADLSFPTVHVSWADACIVVYSIGNSSSFEAAATMLEKIQSLKMPFYLPVLLLANQKDLEHLRQVIQNLKKMFRYLNNAV